MGLFGKKRKNINSRAAAFEGNLLTDRSPFGVQEAYKTLRTNVMFSVAGNGCKKVTITSAIQGEAKSTTAVNLAIAFAQNGERVLLIDGDLRLPTAALKLGARPTPGLSNLLVGKCSLDSAIQRLKYGFDFIPAGDVPPNPTELLGSESMFALVKTLEQEYDYIFFDTPPVCTVADATILSQITSGVIMVVRQHVADRDMVDEAIRRLEFANAKLLGFVYTGVENDKQKSYKKNGYGYDYANSYSHAATKAQPRKKKKKSVEGKKEEQGAELKEVQKVEQ